MTNQNSEIELNRFVKSYMDNLIKKMRLPDEVLFFKFERKDLEKLMKDLIIGFCKINKGE